MTGYPKSTLRKRWWETSTAVLRPYLKAWGITLRDVIDQLDALKRIGFDTLEIFAPCRGGECYNGLDTIDPYDLDPALGTMADFTRLLSEAHARSMAVTVFINLGYCAEHAPAFLKACQDLGRGVGGRETRWFVWSEQGQEMPEGTGKPDFLHGEIGHWWYNETARRFYWVRWEGKHGGHHLPQFNFADPMWRKEAARIVDFWLRTGIDGIVLDAVKWYSNATWQTVRGAMTDVILSADNQLIHPEGAGSWNDDPVPWLSRGGFNCVTDYAMKLGREQRDIIRDAVLSGDPRPIERTLQGYRDRVVAAGGICYLELPDVSNAETPARRLGAAVAALIGEWPVVIADIRRWSDSDRADLERLLALRRRFPALCAAGARRALATSDDSKYYAFMCQTGGGETMVVVVMNFQPADAAVRVTLGSGFRRRLRHAISGEAFLVDTAFDAHVSAYGFEIWVVAD